MQFIVSLLNPFRFVNLYPALDPRYNSLPFDLENDVNNPNGQYIQPWEKDDTAKIQVLSDYTPGDDEDQNQLSWDFYVHGGITDPYINVPLNVVPKTVLGETFSIYEGEVDFNDFDSGIYYSELSYIDENNDRQVWQTSLIHVATKHYKTRLIQYSSPKNEKGVIFDTGIIFNIRIESIRRNYTPKANTTDYIDQDYNNYLLNDTPYRIFTFYIGSARGLPDWIIDKMNLIFTLKKVKIDYEYYSKESGQQFELTRPTGAINEDGFMAINIIPIDNINLSVFETGDLPTGDLIVIRKTLPFKNNAGDITVAGVFTTYTNFVAIAIINKGGDVFQIKVGTSAPVAGVGSDDIATLNITADETSYHLINNYFKVAKTVYITGFGGTSCDVYLVYDQLDAPIIDTPAEVTSPYPKGHFGFYYEVDAGDFELDWSVAGVGQRKYIGCVLIGTGGVDDMTNHYIGVWDRTSPSTRQVSTGSDEINIIRGNLPNDIFPTLRGSTGGKPAFGGGVPTLLVTYDPGTNKNIGNPIQLDSLNTNPQVPIQNIPLTFNLPAFVKITDD